MFDFSMAIMPEEKEFEPIPDGIYEVDLVKIEKKISRERKNHYINWHFKISEGRYKNRYFFKKSFIGVMKENQTADEKRIKHIKFGYLKKDAKKFNLILDKDYSEKQLENEFQQIINSRLIVEKVISENDYENINIKKVLYLSKNINFQMPGGVTDYYPSAEISKAKGFLSPTIGKDLLDNDNLTIPF